MSRKSLPLIIEAADKVKHTWTANPTFVLGDLKLADFTAAHGRVMDLGATIDVKRHELQGLLDQRDDHAAKLQDLSSRALSGFRAVFGPNSQQYDQAGGVRTADRTTRRRGPAKTSVAAP